MTEMRSGCSRSDGVFRGAAAAIVAAALLVSHPSTAEAYVGPGAGIVLMSVFAMFATLMIAALSLAVWPLRMARRLMSAMFGRPDAARKPSLVLLAVMVVAVSQGAAWRRTSTDMRVVVLGFDGMDYAVARELMAAGRMPNFSRLTATGTFTALTSSTPPQSPVAWSSFITGLDPGGHGIFDFIHRDPHTMTPYLSTTKTEAPAQTLTIGSWQLPLSSPRVTLLRHGQPFWEVLERHGIRTSIIRVPANFPPSGTASHELSGMGTPDILGTYGTFSFFSSSPATVRERPVSGGRVVPVDVVDGVVRGELVGPDNPFRKPARQLRAPFSVYLDAQEPRARIVVGEQERILKVGEWSDWVSVEFPLIPTQTLRAICRFYLKQTHPMFELYVSPINLDPTAPAMPISTPASFAAELAHATGHFHTQGMPEDTKALSEGVLTRDEFLQQAAFAGDEVTRQYWSLLDGFTSGLLFYHFGNLDQVSHMMWRARDSDHPAFDPDGDAPYRSVVDDLYVAFDRIVGETLRRIGPDTTLIVMSDHGFASWRRSFHLNTWLRENGYLAVRDETATEDGGLLQNIDWTRTRAYGLGLNGLYLNVRGRERWGIVAPEERSKLVDEIRERLLRTIDPVTNHTAVAQAYPREQIYSDSEHFALAPDIIVGYTKSTRVSNESALGGVSGSVFADNTGEWTGDHCMDTAAVPGILLTNRPLRKPAASLGQLAGAILAEFDIRR